ncbi:metallophosphoesterase [Halobacteriales archaeon QS_3_64_16]|nr:MAG: metallophosphoesterase [Halobacteriales archaeon QS_3_64_16]
MLILGDAHADDPANRQALLHAYDAAEETCALQAGDLMYYDLPYRTYFVAGNNEDFDVIDALRRGDSSLTDEDRPYLLASTVAEIEGLRVAGLSGNYAPTRYEKSREELRGDRRRHFTHEDVERARSLTDIDVFLAHEAPHGLISNADYEVGNRYVDTIIEELSPALCLVGHHHRHAESVIGGTQVISLAPVWESYYRLEPAALSLERYKTPAASA